jgi:hypothetical protein
MALHYAGNFVYSYLAYALYYISAELHVNITVVYHSIHHYFEIEYNYLLSDSCLFIIDLLMPQRIYIILEVSVSAPKKTQHISIK